MNTPKSWQVAREEVLLFCKRMQAERLVYYTAGNISCRIADDSRLVAVTPAATAYDTMTADDIVIVTVDGEVVDGHLKPTSELPLHTLVYARRDEVGGIVHTHSPAAMAMSILGLDLPPILTGLISAAGGSVSTPPYARPFTADMADFTAEALRDRSACFIRNHGLVAIGSTTEQAYNAASVVEGAADAYLRALPVGRVLEVPAEDIERIHQKWMSRWPTLASR